MKKAFTIIELIVVIVILGIVAGLGIEIIKFSYDNEQRVRALNELELKSQATMDFLTTHLNNAVKNSFRLKKSDISKCADSISECKFVFNLNDTSLVTSDFKIFEWARVAIIDKKQGKWNGLNETKAVIEEALNDETYCYNDVGGKTYFNCFSFSRFKKCSGPTVNANDSIVKKYGVGTKLGIYFLGDNIATSTSFMEKDLYELERVQYANCTIPDELARIELKLDEKNFTMSNVYVLVDKIEGVKVVKEDDKLQLKYYSYDFKDKKTNFTTDASDNDKVTLINNVSEFSVSSNNGITKINLCLEIDNLPGSFINKKTSLKVCKSGVII